MPGRERRECGGKRECRILEILVHRRHEEVGVFRRALGMPGAQSQLDAGELRARRRRQGKILVTAIGRIAAAGRKSVTVHPGEAERRIAARAADAAFETGIPAAVVPGARLDAAAILRAAARDHVDDAADGVRTVQRRARTLDDFDALDQFGRDVLDRGAADGPGIDAHAVNQHEHVIGVCAAQEQRSLLAGAAEARHLDPGAHAQQVAEIRGRLAPQFRAGDDIDACDRAIRRNFRAGGGDDDGFQRMGAGDGGDQQ